MTFTTFETLANESILFAQCRAEMCGVSPLQVSLWSIAVAARSVH